MITQNLTPENKMSQMHLSQTQENKYSPQLLTVNFNCLTSWEGGPTPDKR